MTLKFLTRFGVEKCSPNAKKSTASKPNSRQSKLSRTMRSCTATTVTSSRLIQKLSSHANLDLTAHQNMIIQFSQGGRVGKTIISQLHKREKIPHNW